MVCTIMFGGGKNNQRETIAYDEILPETWNLVKLNYTIKQLEAFYYCSLGCRTYADNSFRIYGPV